MNRARCLVGMMVFAALCPKAFASDEMDEVLYCKIAQSQKAYVVTSTGPERTVKVEVEPQGSKTGSFIVPNSDAVVAGSWADLSEVKLLLVDPKTSDANSNIVFKLKVKYNKKTQRYTGSLNSGLSDALSESGSVICDCVVNGRGGACKDPLQADQASSTPNTPAQPSQPSGPATGPVRSSGSFSDYSIQTQMDSSLDMRYVREVLKGVLYRGGGSAGQETPLNNTQLQALCRSGFSAVDYAYLGEKPTQISCEDNGRQRSYIYESVPNVPSQASVFLKHVYTAIKSGNGPVMVHCWNGWHESGELSAYALRQFCGWSGQKAGDYWKATIGDTFQRVYQGVINNINDFKPDPSLAITAAEQAQICPAN